MLLYLEAVSSTNKTGTNRRKKKKKRGGHIVLKQQSSEHISDRKGKGN